MDDILETENGTRIRLIRVYDPPYYRESPVQVSIDQAYRSIRFPLTHTDLIALRDTLNRYIDKD